MEYNFSNLVKSGGIHVFCNDIRILEYWDNFDKELYQKVKEARL